MKFWEIGTFRRHNKEIVPKHHVKLVELGGSNFRIPLRVVGQIAADNAPTRRDSLVGHAEATVIIARTLVHVVERMSTYLL